jgi:PAS domain-containing protein
LQTYRLIDSAIERNRYHLLAEQRRELEIERERVLLDILSHDGTDARVAVAQLEFIVMGLEQLAGDTIDSARLVEACQLILRRLAPESASTVRAAQLPGPGERPAWHLSAFRNGTLDASDRRFLDSLSDRVGLLDLEYRYLYTNAANARHHGKDAADFVGRTSASMVGDGLFRNHTKPMFDAAFAGRSTSVVVAQHAGADARIYSTQFDPVIGPNGRCMAVLAVARDITAPGVVPDVVLDGSWR